MMQEGFPVGVRLFGHESDFRQDDVGVQVCHCHHGFLLRNPCLYVQQGIQGRNGKETQQCRPAPREERVFIEKQPIERIEQRNGYVYF